MTKTDTLVLEPLIAAKAKERQLSGLKQNRTVRENPHEREREARTDEILEEEAKLFRPESGRTTRSFVTIGTNLKESTSAKSLRENSREAIGKNHTGLRENPREVQNRGRTDEVLAKINLAKVTKLFFRNFWSLPQI